MSLAVLGCKDDALVQITTLTVSLPATDNLESGWSLIAVSITQDANTQTVTLTEQATSLTVPITNSTELSVSTIAAQVNNGSSVGWYTSTQAFDPLGGINSLEIQNSPAPQQTANFQPQLYHAEAQSNVAWSRDLAILFVDLATGFTTSPVFKTNQELTMPVGVNWVAVFVDESNYGTEIDTYASNISDIVAYHNSIVSNSEGLVFFDHDEGLVLNSTGGVSMGVQGLVGYDADSHSGMVPLVIGMAPSVSANVEENVSSSTDTVEEGSLVLTEIAGFPETDAAFSIECAASESCSTETGWQACTQPFDVNQSTMFMVRYDEIPTLGCLSFEVRMDTDVDLGGSCADGRACNDQLTCECAAECAAGACGTPGCGSCGVCAATEYCGNADEEGTYACRPLCDSGMNGADLVGPQGLCIMGRQLHTCFYGVAEQRQCAPAEGLSTADYICDTTTDGFAVCVDTRDECDPNCNELRLGETDGCNQICGKYHDDTPLPCGDVESLSCGWGLPNASCVDGFWQFN